MQRPFLFGWDFMRAFLRCLLLFMAAFSTQVWAEETSHVLLLNSYHYGMDWTDG